MRKKLALLLAAIMVIGMIPMTAFATTTNRISNVVTGEEDAWLGVGDGSGDPVIAKENTPMLRVYEKDLQNLTTQQTFELDLANAEWNVSAVDAYLKANVDPAAEVLKLTAKKVIVTAAPKENIFNDGKYGIEIPMFVQLTDNGDATVTIDPMDSVISSGTYKFATVTDGDAVVTVEGVRNVSENGRDLKIITIKETTAGALKATKGPLKLKLSSGWEFTQDPEVTVYPKDSVKVTNTDLDNETAELTLDIKDTDVAKTITIKAWVKYDEDDVDPGDICEMTVSGYDVTKTTLEVAKAVTYGVSWTAEDKDLPVIYWGTADTEVDTLEVTLEEDVAGSWLADRKSKIVFPDGIRVIGVDVSDEDGVKINSIALNDDANELTLDASFSNDTKVSKSAAEVHFTFQLSVKPGFTGDITATLCGKGFDEEIEAVVATAVAPVTVEADKTDVVIDYRHTAVGDITITEAEAGILEKGTKLGIRIEGNYLDFDEDPTVEVVSGDLKIKDVDVDYGMIYITIDSESAKEAAVIKITGCELMLDRSIPSGSYGLQLRRVKTIDASTITTDDNGANKWDKDTFAFGNVDKIADTGDAIFHNTLGSGSEDNTWLFDKGSVTIYSDYVNVVTAGRDQDDQTFTTTIKVTIGATEMYANDKAIALDVPAYIANGYTMLPVRAVTEALSGAAIVRWDDATKTVTITFGARVINMTVGSNVMVINGVEVPMQAACEITNSRAFIPLRDLGYALGLNDSKINWDDATKTATLN